MSPSTTACSGSPEGDDTNVCTNSRPAPPGPSASRHTAATCSRSCPHVVTRRGHVQPQVTDSGHQVGVHFQRTRRRRSRSRNELTTRGDRNPDRDTSHGLASHRRHIQPVGQRVTRRNSARTISVDHQLPSKTSRQGGHRASHIGTRRIRRTRQRRVVPQHFTHASGRERSLGLDPVWFASVRGERRTPDMSTGRDLAIGHVRPDTQGTSPGTGWAHDAFLRFVGCRMRGRSSPGEIAR